MFRTFCVVICITTYACAMESDQFNSTQPTQLPASPLEQLYHEKRILINILDRTIEERCTNARPALDAHARMVAILHTINQKENHIISLDQFTWNLLKDDD